MLPPVLFVNLPSNLTEYLMFSTADNSFVFFKRDHKTFDVFKGPGWDLHTCFVRQGPILKMVSGTPVSADEYKMLNKELK